MAEVEFNGESRSPERGVERGSAPRFLTIGRILAPFGVQGEMKVQILTEFPERFADLRTVYLNEVPYQVQSSWLHKGAAILKLEGIDTPEAVAGLRGQLAEIPREEAIGLPPGHYYHYQILGLRVVTATGEDVGEVTDIIHTGANDVFVVPTPRGEALIPVVQQVVKDIDPEKGRIVIELLPGLLP